MEPFGLGSVFETTGGTVTRFTIITLRLLGKQGCEYIVRGRLNTTKVSHDTLCKMNPRKADCQGVDYYVDLD